MSETPDNSSSLDFVGKKSDNHQQTWINEKSPFLFIQKSQEGIKKLVQAHKKKYRNGLMIFFFLLYGVYFLFCLVHSVSANVSLIVLTSISVTLILYVQIRNRFGSSIDQRIFQPLQSRLSKYTTPAKWIVTPLLLIGIVCYFVLDLLDSAKQLIPLGGFVICLLIPFLTSKHVTRIRFRPVVLGIALQFVLGVLVLRWRPGYLALKFISDEFNKFLAYSLAGAAMAFGDPFFFLHPFLMLVTPMVIFIGGVTGLLFHIGVTQTIVNKMAWLMRRTMGTTGIESVSLTANIFFSMLEMMQMFRSYLPKLTKSEFHTFVVGSHATIAGFAYGLFVLFGANPQHLLTAAVMSAPAAVAISKLNYPETERSVFRNEEDCQVEPTGDSNAIEALANGAWQAGKTMAVLLIQVIAFMAGFEWLDVTVAWFGQRLGIEISLRIIFSYMFLPFAYVIGVDHEDIEEVSSVVGLKLVTSEILAFMELGQLRHSQKISERSAAITTYAICGLSSLGTIAMLARVWATVNERQSRQATTMLPRIYINCNLACILTACVAGILYKEEESEEGDGASSLFVLLFGLLPSYKDVLGLIW